MRHREQVFDGGHEAIIEVATFERARVHLNNGAPRRQSPTNTSGAHLLQGRVFDRNGNVLRSTHANKKGVRYRYYVSKDALERSNEVGDIWRLSAVQLERLVEQKLRRFLDDGARLSNIVAGHVSAEGIVQVPRRGRALRSAYDSAAAQDHTAMVRALVSRVDLQLGKLIITVNLNGLLRELGFDSGSERPESQASSPAVIECPMSLRRRGIETRLVLTDPRGAESQPDTTLVAAIAVAHHYLRQLTDGSDRSLSEVAAANGVDRSDFARILRLAFLSPRLVDAILSGTQPIEMTARNLARLADLSLSWGEQKQKLLLNLD